MKKRKSGNPLSNKIYWFSRIQKSRNDYVRRFNDLARKEGAVKASSILFEIKEGIEKLIETNQDSINEKLSVIIDYLEKETKNEKALPDLAKLLLVRAKNFHKPDLFNSTILNRGSFRLSLKSYYQKYNGIYWHISDEYFDTIEGLKDEVNKYSVAKYALTSLIKEILNKDYPDSLENLPEEELEEEINKQGRPFDETAPQDAIKEFVLEALQLAKDGVPEYKRFWHFEGQHKDSPNKKQLREALIENGLNGELSEETVKERVNKALDELG